MIQVFQSLEKRLCIIVTSSLIYSAEVITKQTNEEQILKQ